MSRYAGQYEHVFEATTAGVTLQAPQLDINTVAAGGGSRLFFRSAVPKHIMFLAWSVYLFWSYDTLGNFKSLKDLLYPILTELSADFEVGHVENYLLHLVPNYYVSH